MKTIWAIFRFVAVLAALLFPQLASAGQLAPKAETRVRAIDIVVETGLKATALCDAETRSAEARFAVEIASRSPIHARGGGGRLEQLRAKYGRIGELDARINARAGFEPRAARAAEVLGNTGENASVLSRNLALEGRPVGAGQAAGHLVPSTGSKGHWAAGADARELLQHSGVRINSGANGIPIGHPRPHNLTHRGAFLRDLESRLSGVSTSMEAAGYGHRAIRSALQRELRAIGQGVPK